MQTKVAVKQPEPVSARTNHPVSSNPPVNNPNVRTTDYQKLLQFMFNDPDTVTREDFLFIQSAIGYRRAAVLRAQAKQRKLQRKIEPADAGTSPILMKKSDAESKKDSDGKSSDGSHAASSSDMPPDLRAGLEKLSGVDLSDVKVHQNSDKPQQVGALAYTQGNDIHVAPGQERHLPHEGWHAVQQKQGIVKATMQMKSGEAVNDDAGLEHEADVMGAKAAEAGKNQSAADDDAGQGDKSRGSGSTRTGHAVIQKKDEASDAGSKIKESELEEIQLKGMAHFKAPPLAADYLKLNPSGARIRVRYGSLAQGTVKITRSGNTYNMIPQALSMSKGPFSAESAIAYKPCLVVSLNNGKLDGFMSIWDGTNVPKMGYLKSQFISDPSMLGLRGINLDNSLQILNSIDNGILKFGINNAAAKVGGVFSSRFSFHFEPESGRIGFSGSADINVKGLANGTLTLTRTTQGKVTGSVGLAVNLTKHFTGGVLVKLDGESVTGEGKVGYLGEKLSGQVILKLGDKAILQRSGRDQTKQTKPAAGKKPQYALSGEGDLLFQFTDWLNGTAHCEVDEKGNVTILGQIVPQAELELFPQKDFIKPLFQVEARAVYGIPVVGNVFVFASLGLEAFAKLGPAKLYKIAVSGTYSTDPEKCKDFSIQGSLNISAAAGIRLVARGGAGVEILDHDIKAGVSLTAMAGLQAYAEATPIIGYKENARPGQDKKGDFFLSGELEIGAQPFFGLGGDLFVLVDSPWWSPLGDQEWKWPLFNRSYPLGGSFGLLAKVNHILGSKQAPEVEFGKVDFSADKFITDLMNDKAGGKKAEEKKPGKWNEKNSKAAQPPKGKGKKDDAKGKKGSTLDVQATKTSPKSNKKKGTDPNARTADGKTVKQHQDETVKRGKKGNAAASGKKKPVDKTNSEKKSRDEQLIKGLKELEGLTSKYERNNGATLEEIRYDANAVNSKYAVISSIQITDGGKDWDYKYTFNPTETKDGPKKGNKILSPKVKFKDGSKSNELWVERGSPGSKNNVVLTSGQKNIEKDKDIWSKLDQNAKDKVSKLKQPKNQAFTQQQVKAAASAVEKCLTSETDSPIIGKKHGFKLGKESHSLWVEKQGSKKVVMVASPPQKARDSEYARNADVLKEIKDAEKQNDQSLQTGSPQKDVIKAIKSAGESKAQIRNWKGELVKIPEEHIMSPRDPDFSQPPIFVAGPFSKEQRESFLVKGTSAGTKLAPHHRHQIPIRDGGVMDELRGPGHPGGNEHTAGSPGRHPGDSIFNSEVGGNKLRNDEIKAHWKTKGERLVEIKPGVWRDPGPK